MITLDPTTLTFAELAACADEYIRRTAEAARAFSPKGTLTISLWAYQYGWNTDQGLTIDHSLTLEYEGNDVKLKGANLEQLLNKHKIMAGVQVTPPRTFQPALPAPAPAPPEDDLLYEEAEFTPVETRDDDVPL